MASLSSEALSCIVKYIHFVAEMARVKQDTSAVSRGRGRKGLTFEDNRWSKTYVPTGPRTALRVHGTGGKEDAFVEEATSTFIKHVVKYRMSTQSVLVDVKIAEVGEDADVKGICHLATIVPKDGNTRPFLIHLAAPPIYMSKARVHVCS